MKRLMLAVGFFAALAASAEIQVINGVKYECKDGMCMPIFDDDPVAAPEVEVVRADAAEPVTRMAQGYMDADRFVAFLNGEELSDGVFEGKGIWLVLLLVLLGGVAMNLTPCVLPMMPINLMVIGKSASRGLWYGAGIAVSYGVLGLLAALGGMAFGEIQGNPWFNCVVAVGLSRSGTVSSLSLSLSQEKRERIERSMIVRWYRVRACLFPAMGHSALIDKFTKIKRDNDKKS